MVSRLTKIFFFCLALTAFHAMTMIPLSSAYAFDKASVSVGEPTDTPAAAIDTDMVVTPQEAVQEHDAEHSDTGSASHAESSPGFPQLNIATYPSQIFWLFISFIILYALMSKLALPRVSEVIDARRDLNEENLSKAAAMQAEAEELKNSYTVAMNKAQSDAQAVMAAMDKEIADKSAASASSFAEKARIRLQAAEQAVAKAKQNILADMADVAADLAADITNKLSGAQVTKADAKKTVTGLMKGE